MKILAHTSFIGNTGYNNHARSFFTALNKFHTVKVRNYTIGPTWKGFNNTCHDDEPYMTDEIRDMLILQTLYNNDGTTTDFPIYKNKNHEYKADIHIVLNDLNHRYFYENYDGYTIGYNVWESTEYPQDFFNQIKKFDEFWVPSEWQKTNLIKQGYPSNKIFVVPEGVDGDVFYPENTNKNSIFTFLLFGRWEYRKSTKEIIDVFIKTFKENEPVKLIVSADNSYANDGFKSTEERLENYNLKHEGIEVIHFPNRDEYINYLKTGDVFISCARSEGWNLPLIEAMACGIPSIYSNWGGQLEFANNLGIPIRTLYEVPASNQESYFVGNYIEPDFKDLSIKMRDVYENYNLYKLRALNESKQIIENFKWEDIAKKVSENLDKIKIITKENIKQEDFVFVTIGNYDYMPVIEKLVKSISQFSKAKIIVYGVNCEIPFDFDNLIKKTINPPQYSKYDKWYWKQYACIESINEGYSNYVWIDGDVVVNHNIDTIEKYFNQIENYPIADIHRQEEFFGFFNNNGQTINQSFNENLCKLLNVQKRLPYMHVCLFIYNKNCKWWFEEIINLYKSIDLSDYEKYFLWNDEGIDNALRWKYGYTKHLPLSNFDTSSYDGDFGQTNNQLVDFYKFWGLDGPYNFNKIYGYQYIPENKNDILYFHGNKNGDISDKMINFIDLQKDNKFYQSEYFYIDEYNVQNLGEIKDVPGSTMEIAERYGWPHAIYHEIYNLKDYYIFNEKRIKDGDVVVDLGGNIGIFNRWAYSQGASKVISFEPDKRYFKLLKKNSHPNSILFNAAVSNKMGSIELIESSHLGGSHILGTNNSNDNKYSVRMYTLNYLFEKHLIDKIDFLKVDIEGAEILAFDGISDENLLKISYIAMEYHHGHLNYNESLRHNFIARLNNLGFNSYMLFLGNGLELQLIYFYK
jgi:FkbM family methyltransferase